MNQSEKLLKELADAKIITEDYDKAKAQLIIRQFFCNIHNEAVLETVIATNKKNFIHPNFHD